MSAFPGSEDYEEGCDPVRELTLLEQIQYWKTRSRIAEELAHKYRELDQVESEAAAADRDAADWWKTGSSATD